MQRFRGLIPPMITPLTRGQVDSDGVKALVEHTVDHLDGMVVGGSCGEGPSLGREGRSRVLGAFIEALAGRIPVIAGVASTSIDAIRSLVEEGDSLGVVGYLVPPPFYFANSEDGVREFYRQVSELTNNEIMVYDNPRASKTVLSVDLLASLVDEFPNVNHIKVTDPDIDKVTRLRERSDATLLAGSDEVMHHQVLRGCEGAVTAVPQVFPVLCRAWFDAACRREGDGGRGLYDRMLPLVVELLLGPDQYPAVVKYALAHLEVIATDEVLAPLTPLNEDRRRELAVVMEMSEVWSSSAEE